MLVGRLRLAGISWWGIPVVSRGPPTISDQLNPPNFGDARLQLLTTKRSADPRFPPVAHPVFSGAPCADRPLTCLRYHQHPGRCHSWEGPVVATTPPQKPKFRQRPKKTMQMSKDFDFFQLLVN